MIVDNLLEKLDDFNKKIIKSNCNLLNVMKNQHQINMELLNEIRLLIKK